MSLQLRLLVQDCLERLHSLQIFKENLTEVGHYHIPKRLCEWLGGLLLIIQQDLKEDSKDLNHKETNIPEVRRLLESLAKLLAEMEDFVAQFDDKRSLLKLAHKVIVNVEVQTKLQTQLQSFHARIHEIQEGLLSQCCDSVDFKDIKVTMDVQAMVDWVIQDMTDHSLEIVYMKELVKELIAHCSKQKTEVMCALLELHNRLLSGFRPKQEEVVRAITSLHNALKLDHDALHATSPMLFLHCCWFHWSIPVELRMIIGTYVLLKTELSHISTYEGNMNEVKVLAFSASENRLYSASHYNTIKVWNAFSTTWIATLQGHNDCVMCLCPSSQRHRLFSGSSDTTIKVWDTETWQCLHTLEGHTNTVTSLVVDEIIDRLYSASFDNTIIVWDLHTLTCIRTLQGHTGWICCLCLSVTSNLLYSGSLDKTIKVWNTVSCECVSTIQRHKNNVYSLVLSEDGSRLYSAGGLPDNTIKVWDTATNTCVATLQGRTNGLLSLCLSFKTKRLISASFDRMIRVWDTTTNTCIHTVTETHDAAITRLTLSDQSDILYVAYSDKTIRAWRLKYSWA
jgi:hypothetical protein